MSKISVIVPYYKGNKYLDTLKMSLDAACSNYPDEVEVVLVNDSPNDQVIYKNIKSDKYDLVLVNHSQNQGIHQARVTGLDKSSGEYILFLDQDDKINEKFFSEMAPVLDEDYSVAFTFANGYCKIIYILSVALLASTMPAIISAQDSNVSNSTLMEGAYGNGEIGLASIPNTTKILTTFVADKGDRSYINCSDAIVKVGNDVVTVWDEPTEQINIYDAMAKAIEDAIKALQLKPTPETTTTIPETTTTEQVTTNQETTTVEQVPTTSKTEATAVKQVPTTSRTEATAEEKITMVNPTETETQYITISVNNNTPKTGENSNITLWMIVFFITAGGILTIALEKRK